MRRHFYPFLGLLALSLPLATSAAHAQNAVDADILRLKDGHALLNIAASERTLVMQDLLSAHLRIDLRRDDAALVQRDINETMQKALAKAKSAENLEVSTGQYYVYSIDETPPQPRDEKSNTAPAKRSWQGGQTITLKGKDAKTLLDTARDLQAMGLVMNGLDYSISPDLQEETRDALMEAALGKLRARAERAAKALGKSKVELVEITVDSPQTGHPMMMRAMAASAPMEDAMPAPLAEPEQSEISLNVSARALLKP